MANLHYCRYFLRCPFNFFLEESEVVFPISRMKTNAVVAFLNCSDGCNICKNVIIFDDTFKCTSTGNYYKIKKPYFIIGSMWFIYLPVSVESFSMLVLQLLQTKDLEYMKTYKCK